VSVTRRVKPRTMHWWSAMWPCSRCAAVCCLCAVRAYVAVYCVVHLTNSTGVLLLLLLRWWCWLIMDRHWLNIVVSWCVPCTHMRLRHCMSALSFAPRLAACSVRRVLSRHSIYHNAINTGEAAAGQQRAVSQPGRDAAARSHQPDRPA
jgi:hypothetical protein